MYEGSVRVGSEECICEGCVEGGVRCFLNTLQLK